MGILEEIKKLFLATDEKIENLSVQTLNTRRAPKEWLYILQREYRTSQTATALLNQLFYKNKRKTDIVLRSFVIASESYTIFKIYTKKQIIFEIIENESPSFSLTQYAPHAYDDLNLIIHPNESIFVDIHTGNTLQTRDMTLTMQFEEP